jgi:hypothetical protein
MRKLTFLVSVDQTVQLLLLLHLVALVVTRTIGPQATLLVTALCLLRDYLLEAGHAL